MNVVPADAGAVKEAREKLPNLKVEPVNLCQNQKALGGLNAYAL